MTVKIKFRNEIMSRYCGYLSPLSECSDQTRAAFTVAGRRKMLLTRELKSLVSQ